MKKLTKVRQKEVENLSTQLQSQFEDLQEACEKKDKEAIEQVIGNYNEILTTAKSLCEEIGGEIRDYIDSKSESWQEGDKCTTFEAWAEQWEEFDPEEVTLDMLQSDDSFDTSDIENWGERLGEIAIEVEE